MKVGWGNGRRYQDWLNRTRPTVTDKGVQGMSSDNGTTRPDDFTEDEIEQAMADSYVSMPIADYASLAAAVNKALEQRYGPAE